MKQDNSVDSDQVASSEATWSGSKLFSMQDVSITINQNMKYRIVLIILSLSKDK